MKRNPLRNHYAGMLEWNGKREPQIQQELVWLPPVSAALGIAVVLALFSTTVYAVVHFLLG